METTIDGNYPLVLEKKTDVCEVENRGNPTRGRGLKLSQKTLRGSLYDAYGVEDGDNPHGTVYGSQGSYHSRIRYQQGPILWPQKY